MQEVVKNSEITRSFNPSPSYQSYKSIEDKVIAGIELGRIRVLFTDIDATLVLGAGHHEHEISQSHLDAKRLIASLNEQNAIIIPITGSHFESATTTTTSIKGRIANGILPGVDANTGGSDFYVDAYVSDGGAKAVHSIVDQQASFDDNYKNSVNPGVIDYQRIIGEVLDIRTLIDKQNLASLDWDLIKTYDRHAGEERINLQPGTVRGDHQKSNKIALHFYAASLEDRDLIESIYNKEMSKYGLKTVCCEEKDANSFARRLPISLNEESFPFKYCLDIVPFNKASAVEYFMGYVSHEIAKSALNLNKNRPLLEVWACGDSGNDFPLLSSSEVTHVVIVGGASKELIRLKDKLEELGKKVYLESDSQRLGPASIIQAIKEA
jgi:hydroxymethylpyrimidine pyrophosphatase-like HAD family hydrolase